MSAVETMDTLDVTRRAYWNEGFVVLRDVYGEAEVQAWRAESERLWKIPGIADDLNLRSEFRRTQDGDWVLDRLDPVLDISPVLRRAACDDRLLGLLRGLLGGPASLLKCKLIRKDPHTGGYAHHQDYRYWQWLERPADHLCSVAIPFFDSDATSGGIELFAGAHRRLLPAANGTFDEDFDLRHLDVSTGVVPVVRPGDVLVFHGLAPHRSGPNHGPLPRTLLLPSYSLGDDPDLYARYYRREIRRRCSDYVGFERHDATLERLRRGEDN